MTSPIQTRIEETLSRLPEGVQLVAVSKFHPAEAIAEAYAAGQRAFGESRVQELMDKQARLPHDIEWHFIGHLQPNKVKYIAPFISLIHAVDTLKLLHEIDKQGAKCGRRIPCLLQLHVAREETKFGFSVEEARQLLEGGEWKGLGHAKICGIMCMASNSDDLRQVKGEFRSARLFFEEARERFFPDDEDFCICSWGMSHDYPVAVEEGATMVRVGSKIFGERA